jgi:hypothetical protein
MREAWPDPERAAGRRAPLGRNEEDTSWFHRHDEYPA